MRCSYICSADVDRPPMLSLVDFSGVRWNLGQLGEASSQPCSAPSGSRPSSFEVPVHRDRKIRIAKSYRMIWGSSIPIPG